MNGLGVRSFNTGTRKVIPDGISLGILSSRGPSTPGCSVWPAMKEMQLSFGISDDWLPGSCVAWNGLLCTIRSSLPILIPSHKSPSCFQAHSLWLSLLAKRSRRRYDRLCGSTAVPPTIPNSIPVHPPSSFLQYLRTKFKRNQGTTEAGHVCILALEKSDRFQAALIWKRVGVDKWQVIPGASTLTSTGADRAGKANTTHTVSTCVFLPLFLSTSSNNALRKHFCDLRWESWGTWCRW